MAQVILTGFDEVERQLAKFPIELRGTVIKAGLRKGGRKLINRAKEIVPPPGYPGDDPELKPLRETLAVEIRDGKVGPYAVCGPKYPAGAHGHFVAGESSGRNVDVRHHSRGKPTGVILKKTPFMSNALKDTQDQIDAAVRSGIDAAIKKATR